MKLIGFFTVMLIALLSLNVQAQETFIATNNDQSLKYFLEGKVEKNDTYTQAWVKVLNADNKASKNNLANFRQNKIEIRANHGQPTQGYDKYLYTIHLYEFDCAAARFRDIEADDYDEAGNVLAKEKTPGSEWIPVVSGTIYGAIGRFACGK